MGELSKRYDRIYKLSQELWDIQQEESAEITFVGGEAFDHSKWLREERKEIQDEAGRMAEVRMAEDEFATFGQDDW